MNPITMKMIQPLAFKGYDDEGYDDEADVSTTPAKAVDKPLERQPEKDVVVKDAEKPTTKPAEKKPEITMKERMDGFNKTADAVAQGVGDFSNSAAKTIVGVTGGAVVVGNAAGPAVENIQKAGKAFKPITDGIKNIVKKVGKKGTAEAGEQGTQAALVSLSSFNLGSIFKNAAKKIRSIF